LIQNTLQDVNKFYVEIIDGKIMILLEDIAFGRNWEVGGDRGADLLGPNPQPD
jgi:hypothetical protein